MFNRELLGWYSFAWAAEPYIVSVVGTYAPILLREYAMYNAVWDTDLKTPCLEVPVDVPGIVPVPGGSQPKCVVLLFGRYIDPSSFALYTFSLSVLVQTLLVISMSGAADRGRFRKHLLVGSAVVGAAVTACYLFVSPRHYYLAAILAILSNAAFGAVSVCGNAFLPVLVEKLMPKAPPPPAVVMPPQIEELGGPSVWADQCDTVHGHDHAAAANEQTPLIGSSGDDDYDDDDDAEGSRRDLERAKLSSRISGTGVAVGYFSALLVQVATAFALLYMRRHQSSGSDGVLVPPSTWMLGRHAHDPAEPGQPIVPSDTWSLRLVMFAVGMWWLVFQLPVAALLDAHPGPSLRGGGSVMSYVAYGWKTLYATIKQAREMKDLAAFLLGWFLISDAATTINSAAVLFARAQLDMSPVSLAIIGVLVVFSGMFGATVAPRLARDSNPVNSIVVVVLIAAVIPIYGILGFFSSSIGLRHPWEMYALAVWYGFALGGLNATCRSVYSLLIPAGKESTFFSLFAVTDKGSSVFGPFITGLITDRTHDIRYTFYFLLVVVLLAALVFHFLIDFKRGRLEARFLEHIDDSDSDSGLD